MKTAKQMRKVQEEATRKWIEHEITFQARGKMNNFTCSAQECPEWLREELIKKGYTVTDTGLDGTQFGINIKW